MIELKHDVPEPPELKKFQETHPVAIWDDAEFKPVRPKVRTQLHTEQEGLCAYCEIRVDRDKGQIDHIKPRNARPDLTFTYENLAHSCDGPDHCNPVKDRQTLPIEPRIGSNIFFQLMLSDGFLRPAPNLSVIQKQDAETTLNILGLNRSPSLVQQRLDYLKILQGLPDPADKLDFLTYAPFRWSLRGAVP